MQRFDGLFFDLAPGRGRKAPPPPKRLSIDDTGIAKFFRLLHDVSPAVFGKFLDQLDFDKPEAKKTIDQLIKFQPREWRDYVKLARAGRLFPGKMGQLSKALWDRLQEH